MATMSIAIAKKPPNMSSDTTSSESSTDGMTCSVATWYTA